MPLSKNLHTFLDVEQILLAARESNGAIYTLANYADAVSWRRRAYQYRKLLAEQTGSLAGPGATPWDDMRLILNKGECDVKILFGPSGMGELRSLGGEPITAEEVLKRRPQMPIPNLDPLLSGALELVKKLGVDDEG